MVDLRDEVAHDIIVGVIRDQDPSELKSLMTLLEGLRVDLLAAEEVYRGRTSKVHQAFQASVRNLLHYVTLRQRDVRDIQERLASLGLSSLGRSESHVLSNLNAVLDVLCRLAGKACVFPEPPHRAVTYKEGRNLIERHSEALLGSAQRGRQVRIMVTLPSEAADDYSLVVGLLRGGMDCARVNCAHDGPEAWARMTERIRTASRELGRTCSILMDLAGPKLRTGPLEEGPKVLKLRPTRDPCGQVILPARVWLTASDAPQPPPVPAQVLPVDHRWLRSTRGRGAMGFLDMRGKRRTLKIVERGEGGVWAECDQTAYVGPETSFWKDDPAKDPKRARGKRIIRDLPPRELRITLNQGDRLVLTADPVPGHNAVCDEGGQVVAPARIPLSLPGIIQDIKVGERIFLDDGKIAGMVEEVADREIIVRIVTAKPGGSRLAAEKGINLPDSDLNIKGLTDQDIEDLAFVATHGDIVALSFVRGPEDVRDLQSRLHQLRADHLGIVIKIETRRALEQFPSILMTAMRNFPLGVMIARGDLAVELGYESLAEAQEEILWICEASHVPVIWATQVLETLSQHGQPSRAEITDAAMSVRAECVMLNKGPYILEALRMLHAILRRMEGHQVKKRSLLGRLHIPKIER